MSLFGQTSARMSHMGQSRSSGDVRLTSALLLITTEQRTSHHVGDGPSPDCLASFARCVLSCEGLGAGIEDDDEGALMGFAGSMRANSCPSQLGFAGAWVTPSGISTQGSFSAHQICRLGAIQLGSSSVPALMNAIAPYAGPWL
jgi:hypothetical protein